jgi:hypothetical protein
VATIYQNSPSSNSASVNPVGAASVSGGVSSSVFLTAQTPVATGYPLPNGSGAQGQGVSSPGFSAGSPASAEVSLNMNPGGQLWLYAALLLMAAYIAFEK